MKPTKPPLGLMPKSIHDTFRLHEVQGAIVRRYDAEMEIPVEWVEEYNELIRNIPKEEQRWKESIEAGQEKGNK